MKTTKLDFDVSIRRYSLISDAICLQAKYKKGEIEYSYQQLYTEQTAIGLVVDLFYKKAEEVFKKICPVN
jgi:hypothetical protein